MSGRHLRPSAAAVAAATAALALLLAPAAVIAPAEASVSGDALVIKEVYGGGGNSGATYTHDFIELYNPTGSPISLDGMSLQYRSAGAATAVGTSNITPLSGTVPANSHWLVQAAQGSGGTEALPAPDGTSTLAVSGTGGQMFLASTTTPLDPGTGDMVGKAGVLDMIGWGSSTTSFETARAASTTNPTSASRNGTAADTDTNSADFTVGTPTPQGSGVTPDPDPEPEPGEVSIPDIQGTGDRSPLEGDVVTTRGVVTAAYPTGGFNGFYLQTEGTGDVDPATHQASDAVFVYGSAATGEVAVGDHVEVTGEVKEFDGLTEVVPAGASDVTVLDEPATAVKPAALGWPTTDAGREAVEGMLLAPQGAFTVTNSFSLNKFAEIGLASGDHPLLQPTDVARPGSEGYHAQVADNAARAVTLDDGASIDFLRFNSPNQDIPLPYLTNGAPIRVGAPVTFTAPVVVDYRFDLWRLQPTQQLTASDVPPVTFTNTRTAAPEEVGGDVRIGTFNVLNYFSTTGEEFEATTGIDCSYFNDRDGNPIGVNRCGNEGPRGAANAENLARQEIKIVRAINALDADVVSLEEIENSAKFGKHRDAALGDLVEALNAEAGAGTWAYVPSPPASALPPLDEQDVIRSAFIYRPAVVKVQDASRVLVGSDAFSNARQPLAQVFKPQAGSDADRFAVIVNHFKSKGSGSGEDADQGDGQGASNASRVRQAEALADFADQFAADRKVEKVFLSGDFNAYTFEDPMQVLYDAGYTNLASDTAGESTYSFSGLSGSLDHVLANDAALGTVVGVDIWNINSVEPVALEYSRYNYNATDFYAPDVYRASDHDPEVVGMRLAKRAS